MGSRWVLRRSPRPSLKAAPNLRVVARHGVGYDTVDVPALTRHNIPLMVTGIANSPSVAEQALFFMFALAKRGAAMHALVRENRWADRLSALPVDLFGKTVLVIGFGRIGSRLAKACLALGMSVLVYDPYVSASAIRRQAARPSPTWMRRYLGRTSSASTARRVKRRSTCSMPRGLLEDEVERAISSIPHVAGSSMKPRSTWR